MPALETLSIPLGFSAPDFLLPDTISGKHLSLSDLRGERATLFLFLCNHCPFVKHINAELVRLAGDYLPKGVAFVAISSNDVEKYPEDSPDQMRRVAAQQQYPFPYLYDQTQEVAQAYRAVCTPDFALFDADLRCVYRGRLDASRPSNTIPTDGRDMRAALNALLNQQAIPEPQHPSIGCSIKWKGEAPY